MNSEKCVCSSCGKKDTMSSPATGTAFCFNCAAVTEIKTGKKVFKSYVHGNYPYNYSEDELFLIICFGGVVKVAANKSNELAEIYKWLEFEDPTTHEGLGLNKEQIQQLNNRLIEGDDVAIEIAKKLTDDEKLNLMNTLFRIFKLTNGGTVEEAAGIVKIARVIKTDYYSFTAYILENTSFNQDELLKAISNTVLQFMKFKKNGDNTEASTFYPTFDDDEDDELALIEKHKNEGNVNNPDTKVQFKGIKNTPNIKFNPSDLDKGNANNSNTKVQFKGIKHTSNIKFNQSDLDIVDDNEDKDQQEDKKNLTKKKKSSNTNIKLLLVFSLIFLISLFFIFLQSSNYMVDVNDKDLNSLDNSLYDLLDVESTNSNLSNKTKESEADVESTNSNPSNKTKEPKADVIELNKQSGNFVSDSEKYYDRAMAKENKKDYNGAINLLNLAISNYDKKYDSKFGDKNYENELVKYYMSRGNILVKLNRYSSAIDDYTKVVQLAQLQISAGVFLWGRGELYFKLGLNDKACKDFNDAAKYKINQASETYPGIIKQNITIYNKACGLKKIDKELISTTNLTLIGGTLEYSLIYKSDGDTTNIALRGVKVENLTTGKKTKSNRWGDFDIKVNLGDDIRFSKRGLESLNFKIYESTISYHIQEKNKFYITLSKKGFKFGRSFEIRD